ncbi:biorientation of chromosomes in cell division protein 1-like 1 isoform X3 [Syngnathus typhle]|uniref:biorientation of chromosomes in cell division protein 1-like 1 isoform X3 n=1 Tax=Syngnathus typhle TaxID=161592 RepID=UPI002A6B0ACC|nr:biorientation of chromosomes in cell division protein 1-like 1 isoform X3 [Syngnathus typhle]
MAGLPPGDPQLVSMIVNHLKTQGLFDQFRRDCLADVDTKPAYLNLKQRVDNFVSNHLSNHTWSPQLNKNQLRNNIRQLVLQSGMLEQGVDRIVAQVVDPKVNHIFRPQVEKVVDQFVSPGTSSEEPPAPTSSTETQVDAVIPQQASTSVPTSTAATDAMSILDAITSLNQEANIRSTEKERKALDEPVEDGEQDMSLDEEEDRKTEEEEADQANLREELRELEVTTVDAQDQMDIGKEISPEEINMQEEEPQGEDQAEEKLKVGVKTSGKPSEEKQEEENYQAKQKAKERIKEEYSLEDSDLDGLSDITVSSVHTSDLSSFEGESEDEEPFSDSSEEGERAPDGENLDKREAGEEMGEEGKESKPRRKAYVHKPFLYSRYYSDSDDEVTVEERRRSAAKDKEERLLKRQQNRERMEEKRKMKAAQSEEQDQKKQKSSLSAGLKTPRAKEARKERKVLEKKVALSRMRKLDSRKEDEVTSKKKGEAGETSKKSEVKSTPLRSLHQKLVRNQSESSVPDERHRITSGSGGISEDLGDAKKLPDKSRTHAFILDLELGSQEALRQRSVGKFDRPSRKERKEKERSMSEELPKLKLKQEKKSEFQVNESQQKENMTARTSSDERSEKKPKVKNEKKMTSTKEPKTSAPEADEASAKRMRALSVDKDKSREKDKMKEKEKIKGAKIAKSESKQALHHDSSGSSEDRPEVAQGVDSGKKKEKHGKDILKRSKSHSEEKPKLKTENKEKTKAEQPNKSLADSDKSPKRVKQAEKAKPTEKSKPREELKSHAASKTDKKTHSLDIRGASGAGKPEKEKKKEGPVKEQRRSSEEPVVKSAKKKADKKEKKEENHEGKKAPTEDKVDKSDMSVSTEAEETPMQATLSESAIVASDGPCEPFSDIAPEAETPVQEMPVVPPEADALLTLMDVCTSAMDARLHAAVGGEHGQLQATLQDADMKMKEAALTLLSMDPDSALSSAFMSHGLKEEPMPEENKQNPQEEASDFAYQTVKNEGDKLNSEEKSEMDAASDQPPLLPAVQEKDSKPQDLSSNEKTQTGEKAVDSALAENEAAPSDEHDAPVADDGTGNVEGNVAVHSCEAATLEHVDSPQVQTASDVVDTLTRANADEILAMEQMDVGKGKLDLQKQEEEAHGAQTVELCFPTGVVTEPKSGTEVAKQESESSDIREPEKNSEVSKKERGRGRPKRKLSNQNVAAVNECVGSDQDAKEPSPEETEQPRVVEVKTPRRGRSSKAAEEVEEEPLKHLEKKEQTPGRRGRRPAPKGIAADRIEMKASLSDEPAVKKKRSAKNGEVGDEMIKNTSEEAMKDTSKEATAETSGEDTNEARTGTSAETISEETLKSTGEEMMPEAGKGTSEEAMQVTDEQASNGKSEEATTNTSVETIKDTSEEAVEDSHEKATKDSNEEATTDVSEESTNDTNEEASKDTSEEASKDTSEEASKDTSEEASKDTSEEASKDTSEEASKDTSEEASKNTSEEASKDTSEEASKDTSEEASKDTSEEASKDTSEEASKDTSEKAYKDLIEEASKGTSEMASEDTSEETSKDTSEMATMETNEDAIMDATDEYTSEEGIKDTHEETMKDTISTPKNEEAKVESGSEKKPDVVDEQQGSTPKKPARRGRPPKAAMALNDSDKKEKTAGEKEAEQNDADEIGGEKDHDGKEKKGRATTRLASRLEAERNKPSKPSTRASRLSGKDETAAAARGTRSPANATKGARKLETSPAAVRTRGGQKPEEPPAKRGKRCSHVNN